MEYGRKEAYNPEITADDNDERRESWEEFETTLIEMLYESFEFKMTISTDNYRCEECGEAPAQITVTKREDDEYALHVVAKCRECGTVDDYYAYIA